MHREFEHYKPEEIRPSVTEASGTHIEAPTPGEPEIDFDLEESGPQEQRFATLADIEMPQAALMTPEVSEVEETVIIPDQELITIVQESFLEQLQNDPDVQAAAMGLVRLLANAGITAVDAFPGHIPEIAQNAVLLLKFFKKANIFTPDVPTKREWLAQGVDVLVCGAIPSHGYATLEQLKHDWPRMRRGVNRIVTLLQTSRNQPDALRTRRAVEEFILPDQDKETHG